MLACAVLPCKAIVTSAQNLAPNPGFEFGDPFCGVFIPTTFNASISDWYTPTAGSPDVYHASLSTQCPNVTVGSTDPYSWGSEVPVTGQAYAALITYCSICPTEEREYAQAQLTAPLQAGVMYHAEMWVSLGDRCDFATDGLGIHFSVTPPSSSDWLSLPVSPQVSGATVIDQANGWTLISGEFMADGPYAFITIGSFLNDVQMSVVPTGSNTLPFACYFIDDVVIRRYDPPFIITGDTMLCEGSTGTLVAINGTDVRWALAETPSTLIGTGDTLIVQPGDTTTYLAMSGGDTAYFTVNVIPAGFADLGPDVTICEGDTLALSVDLPGVMVVWSTGATTPTVLVTGPGPVLVSASIGSCTDLDTILIATSPPPDLLLPEDTVLCPTDLILLDATVPNGMYQWSDGSTEAVLQVSEAGAYTVSIDDGVCTVVRTTVVTDLITGFALTNAIDACEGDSVRLNAFVSGATYTWDDGSTTPDLLVGRAGERTVSIQLPSCTFSAVFDVRFSHCAPVVRMPNVFTPNGDGANDVFLPIEVRDVVSARLTVSDRWGTVHFTTGDLRMAWRATGVSDGTYFWHLVLTDVHGVEHRQHGTVTVLR